MLASSSDEQVQVEITLRSGKSYIGYVVQSPFAIHGKADVEFDIPIRTALHPTP